jgi:hypothetical protein
VKVKWIGVPPKVGDLVELYVIKIIEEHPEEILPHGTVEVGVRIKLEKEK